MALKVVPHDEFQMGLVWWEHPRPCPSCSTPPVATVVGLAFTLGPTLPLVQIWMPQTAWKCAHGVVEGHEKVPVFCVS